MGIFLASKLEGKFVLMYTGLLSLSLLFDLIQISMDVFISGPLVFALIMTIFLMLLKCGMCYTSYMLYRELGGSWSLLSQGRFGTGDYQEFSGGSSGANVPGPPSYERPSFAEAQHSVDDL
eukprot:g2969.t1